MVRLGLCCKFIEQPIKFRTTTVKSVSALTKEKRHQKLASLCSSNADALHKSIEFCHENQIGCFRVLSQVLPLKTHGDCGYELTDLPDGDETIEKFRSCRQLAKEHDVRLSFHPDQFVVLNSPREDVVESSICELEYQAEVAEWIGADVVNIHGGGGYGDKPAALDRFARNLGRLSARVRKRLTVENDDKVYAPQELLPLCTAESVPLVYDVHHHRCLPDSLSVEEATEQAIATWDREPMFHVSSPREGWSGPQTNRHHDYIDARDFPTEWDSMDITVEVEAKAKELAVARLHRSITRRIVASRST